jgi:hypothetical protein
MTDKINHSLFNIAKQPNPQFISGLFILALFGTLAEGNYFALARISWILLSLLFMMNSSMIVYAAFFFAAFFHGSGFAPDFIFTLKHFHIALCLGCVVRLLNGVVWDLTLIRRILLYFMPFILIIFIGFLNYLSISPILTSLRSPLNLSLTMVCSGILVFLLLDKSQYDPKHEIVNKAILFFCGGIGLQIILGLLNFFTTTNYLRLVIPHNNHIGILSVLGFFYAMYSFKIRSRISPSSILSFILVLLLFIGIFFSCSRTSWISFASGFLLFTFCRKKYIENFQWSDFLKFPKKHRILINVLIGLAIGFSLMNQNIYTRVLNMNQLINPEYWRYIIADEQNFGCFGIYRLRDLQNVLEILKASPLTGVGFTRSVMDIHGFVFLTLSATGIIGLLGMLSFGLYIFSKLWVYIRNKAVHSSLRYLATAGLSTLIAWFFISLMESYFLQFAIWITFVVIIYIFENYNFMDEMSKTDESL